MRGLNITDVGDAWLMLFVNHIFTPKIKTIVIKTGITQ